MRVLVTGAPGFIGQHVVRALRERGSLIRALVRSTADVLALKPLDVEICQGKVLDQAAYVAAGRDCEAIFHLAADYRLWTAEREVKAAVRAGLPAVTVYPTMPIGPGDRRPTAGGQMIIDFMQGRLLLCVEMRINVVAVQDVADPHRATCSAA